MNAMMKVSGVMVAVLLAGSVGRADWHGNYRGGCDGGRREYSRQHYDGGRHGGYYRSTRSDWVCGVMGIGLAAALVSTIDRPPVYVQPAPVVVYQSPPQMVYVQQPVVVTLNVQNSNGSFTPVMIRQVGSQWVGPRGEYYDAVPSIGQLRPVYGF